MDVSILDTCVASVIQIFTDEWQSTSNAERTVSDHHSAVSIEGKILMSKFFEEVVSGPRAGRWNHLSVTMNVAGEIRMTTFTWESLECPRHAVVYFDRATQTIAVKPVARAERNSVAVGRAGGGWCLKVRALIEQFEIGIAETIRFNEPKIDEHGRLILELGDSRPYWNGSRVGAFHASRKEPLERKQAVHPKLALLAEKRACEVAEMQAGPQGGRSLSTLRRMQARERRARLLRAKLFEEGIGSEVVEERAREVAEEIVAARRAELEAEFEKKIERETQRRVNEFQEYLGEEKPKKTGKGVHFF